MPIVYIKLKSAGQLIRDNKKNADDEQKERLRFPSTIETPLCIRS
jgi:hypothetical protein